MPATTLTRSRKAFAAARTKHRNLRLNRYEGRNNGGDSTYNLADAARYAAELSHELQGLVWAEHRLAERISENRDAGNARPELHAQLRDLRRRIKELA